MPGWLNWLKVLLLISSQVMIWGLWDPAVWQAPAEHGACLRLSLVSLPLLLSLLSAPPAPPPPLWFSLQKKKRKKHTHIPITQIIDSNAGLQTFDFYQRFLSFANWFFRETANNACWWNCFTFYIFYKLSLSFITSGYLM